MEKKRDLAIILKTIPFEDRHRIVSALTEQHGKITALAKNSIHSRRFGASLEPFTASQWHFTERPGADSALVHLTETHLKRAFDHIHTDFERFSLACLFNEFLLRLLPERAACPEVFRLHSNALALLDEEKGSGISTAWLNAYLIKLLHWSGCGPGLKTCLHCKTPLADVADDRPIQGHAAEAGWTCPPCSHAAPETPTAFAAIALKDLCQFLESPIRKCPALTRAAEDAHCALFRFLEGVLLYHLPGFGERGLKSLRFLEKIRVFHSLRTTDACG